MNEPRKLDILDGIAVAIVLAVVFAIVLWSQPSRAADILGGSRSSPAYVMPQAPLSWTGFYIGAQLGHGATTLSEDGEQGGLDLTGVFGGGRVGGDIQRDSVVVGAWAEYNLSGQALTLSGGTVAEQTDDWSVNARVGIAHGTTLFYGFGGYGQAFFEANGGKAGTLEADAPMWRLGAGIEHRFDSGLSLGLEYAHNWIDADDLLGKGAEDVVDVTEDRIMAVARWRFGSKALGISSLK